MNDNDRFRYIVQNTSISKIQNHKIRDLVYLMAKISFRSCFVRETNHFEVNTIRRMFYTIENICLILTKDFNGKSSE